MLRLLVVFIALALATGEPLPKHEKLLKYRDGRIVGGTQTTIQKRPYQVSLIVSDGTGNYLCGGSIINPMFILTAAHCLVGATKVTVRAGSAYLNTGGTVISTTTYKIHEQYNPQTSDYDIAVVNLKTPLVFSSTIMPIELIVPGVTLAAGTNTIVSGWGTTSEGGSTSNVLREVTVPIVSATSCKASYGTNAITARMICAGLAQGGKDSCQGDSGGPLVLANMTQVGVVSFGYGCARPNYLGVYSNISNLRPWIKLNTGT